MSSGSRGEDEEEEEGAHDAALESQIFFGNSLPFSVSLDRPPQRHGHLQNSLVSLLLLSLHAGKERAEPGKSADASVRETSRKLSSSSPHRPWRERLLLQIPSFLSPSDLPDETSKKMQRKRTDILFQAKREKTTKET